MPMSVPFAPGFVALMIPAGIEEPGVPVASPSVSLEHALRRAEEEMIATIRSNEPRAAERHREMASYYSIRALELIEQRDEGSVGIFQRKAG